MKKDFLLPFLFVLLAVSLPTPSRAVTLLEVARHASPTDCWTVVDGTVFDITAYMPSHPRRGGGAAILYGLCGTDGTVLYDTAHATEHAYLTTFNTIINLGKVTEEQTSSTTTTTSSTTTTTSTTTATTPTTTLTTPTTTSTTATTATIPFTTEIFPTSTTSGTLPSTTDAITTVLDTSPTTSAAETTTMASTSAAATTTIASTSAAATTATTATTTNPTTSSQATLATTTLQELQVHDQAGIDCWVAYHGNVYDLTTYQHPKPVGNTVIFCGTDSTIPFAAAHDISYLDMIADLLIGPLVNGCEDCGEDGSDDDEGTEDEPGISIDSNSTFYDPPNNTILYLEALQAHDSPSDCWTVYFGNVYDVTEFAPKHPVAGPAVIWEYCGADGTEFYSIYHDASLLLMLQKYYLGPYQTNPAQDPGESSGEDQHAAVPRELTVEEVQLHDITTDCWTIMYGDVYDLTHYRHPGARPDYGQRIIYEYSCGTDSTRDYASVHPRDLLHKTKMSKYKIGWVSSAAALLTFLRGSQILAVAIAVVGIMW